MKRCSLHPILRQWSFRPFRTINFSLERLIFYHFLRALIEQQICRITYLKHYSMPLLVWTLKSLLFFNHVGWLQTPFALTGQWEHLEGGLRVFLLHNSYATLYRDMHWNIPRVAWIFSGGLTDLMRVCAPRKYKWQVEYSMVYHERMLYFIPCHRKYSDQHSQCVIHVTHHDKVGFHTVEYIPVFWLAVCPVA